MQLHIIRNDPHILLIGRRLSLSWTEASVSSTCPRSSVQKEVRQQDRWGCSASSPFCAVRPSQRLEPESPLTYYQVKQQSRAKTGCKLFSVIFYCLCPPHQWIHPLGYSRCKTEWMVQFATLSSNFFKTKVSALWHISSIVHQILWDYFQLWESKKIRAQADRKQRFAHCSQLHHLHAPFDQCSQGTATQNISSSWGMTAHRSWLWSLSLQHTSALTSHKPLMSASLTAPGWELACNTAPCASLLLVPYSSHCHTAWHQPWHHCRAKCASKGLSCCFDGSAAASWLQISKRDWAFTLIISLWCCLSSWDTFKSLDNQGT